jgi:predicted methyltransferase
MIQRSGPRRVAVVGNDDLVAVAIAALVIEAVVFDLDECLLDLVERIAARLPEHGLEASDTHFRVPTGHFQTKRCGFPLQQSCRLRHTERSRGVSR